MMSGSGSGGSGLPGGAQPPPQQAKFVMRNDRMRDTNWSQEQAFQHWNTIKEAIDKIYKQQASQLSYEELYRTAYSLVLHKHGELLYTGVKNTTVEQLHPLVEKLLRCGDEDLLKKINETWKQVKLCIIMIKDILMYMDRNYVPKMKLLSMDQVQTSQFKHYVILNQQIRQRLVAKLLAEIQTERDGGIVEVSQLRLTIQMLVELSSGSSSGPGFTGSIGTPQTAITSKKLYEHEFERPFMAETQNYYRLESNHFITSSSCYAYLQRAKQRLTEELDRLLKYLDSSSERLLISTFLKEYVENHALTLIQMENSGLIAMIRNEKYEEIALLYELFSKVPEAFACLTKHLSAFIVSEGTKLMQDDKVKPDEFVANVISLREKMFSIHLRSFNKDNAIDLTIKTSFENFLNQDSDKTAMSLVYYLDDQFKKDFKNLSETEVNDRLERVIKIFRYLQDKDVFEGFYKNSLSKRLLDARGQGATIILEEAEKLLVLKLKEECGFQFTQKLEVMFKDIKMSEDTMAEFRTTSLSKQLTFELSVKVLTTGNWPNEQKDMTGIIASLPREISFCMQNFNKFYNNKHTGRLLHWKPSLGYADIKASLGDALSKHELQTSTFQMSILLLFNANVQLSYQ
jgi:cullin 3